MSFTVPGIGFGLFLAQLLWKGEEGPPSRGGQGTVLRAHIDGSLAPRCRLFATWGCSMFQGLGCSPIKAVMSVSASSGGSVPSVRFPSGKSSDILTGSGCTGQGTVSGREFPMGIGLPKGNRGMQRFPWAGRRLALECKGSGSCLESVLVRAKVGD
ncbi:hypothetical protein Tco_1092783 [Tanacetum coccineum]|uniref:Uncharacterized protein n=1 Tax=Tanacetum coccineum TaxID=301880 RepID=A0ABQ5IAV8_9ASTR